MFGRPETIFAPFSRSTIMGWLRIAPLLLSWVGFFWLGREAAARRLLDSDWRLSWILACLGWGAVVTLLVELSSLAGWLTAGTLFAGWTVVCLALFLGAGSLARKRGATGRDILACCRQWILESL